MALKDINGDTPAPSTMDLFTAAAADPGTEGGDVDTDNSDISDDENDEGVLGDDESGEQDEDGELGDEGDSQDAEAAAAPSVKIKADGKEIEVSLKPDDANLKSLLQWGAIGKRLQSERDKARQDTKERDKSLKELQSKLSEWEEMKELRSSNFERRALDKFFDGNAQPFLDNYYQERLAREAAGEGDAASRLQDMQDSQRYQEYTAKKLESKLEAERKERWTIDETARIKNLTQQAAAKFDARRLGISKEQAERFNQKMYMAAMASIQEAASELKDGESLTPEVVMAAFKKERDELAALVNVAASEKADKKVSKLKEDAKRTAGAVARQGAAGPKVNDFKGMSMQDIVRKLSGRK